MPNEILERIQEALQLAVVALKPFVPGEVKARFKSGDDPVTEADTAVNRALHQALPRNGEGWFSEESADDFSRLAKECLWIVDPLDGTREFIAGIPEWCVSVAFIQKGVAIAGGVTNPSTGEIFLASAESGLTYNGQRKQAGTTKTLAQATILASRSEVKRGEWERFEKPPFVVRPLGSVAYKLACVAAGLADATWTLTPKHEWDIAAGVALVEAAGGVVRTLDFERPVFNKPSPVFSGLIASNSALSEPLSSWLEPYIHAMTTAIDARPR